MKIPIATTKVNQPNKYKNIDGLGFRLELLIQEVIDYYEGEIAFLKEEIKEMKKEMEKW